MLKNVEREEYDVFPNSISINEREYKINVIFSKKKSSSVSVEDDVILFRLSSLLSKREAQSHFKSLLLRMQKRILNNPDKSNELTFPKILERGWFEFNGEKFILEACNIRGIKLIDGVIKYTAKANFEKLEKAIVKLLIVKYQPRLDRYVKELNNRVCGFDINGDISLKLVKSKWGHCTYDNQLMFNLKLLNARTEVLDYVIIHELCHIRVKNHSDKFWREVEKYCPEHKRVRKILKQQPPILFK